MDSLEYQFESSKKFCREGVSYLLKANDNKENICFAIVLLQTAVELLIKHKQIQKLVSKSKTQIKKVLQKTFDELKQETLSDMSDDEVRNKLLGSFQKLRNKIIHEGFSDNRDFETNIKDACLLVIHGFSALLDLGSKPLSPEEKILILQEYIGKQFNEMINFEPYFREVKNIVSKYEDISYCPMCSHKTVVIDFHESLCFLCGFSQPEFSSAYLNCTSCDEKSGFIYDKLNRGASGQYFGKCLSCDEPDEVIICDNCKGNYFLVMKAYANQKDIQTYYKNHGISWCPDCIKEEVRDRNKGDI